MYHNVCTFIVVIKFSPTLSKVLQNCLFGDLWYLVVLFKLLCLLSCVFYSKSFQEGEKKDEWKSDNGFVGNKTETFPQLHHLPPWLYLYPTTSYLSPLSSFIFIFVVVIRICFPTIPSLTRKALSLSYNFIIIIHTLFSKTPSSTPIFHFTRMLMTIMIYNDGPHEILLTILFSRKHFFS